MPIKNYTTTIDAEKSVSQIQDLLRKKGARRVLVDYDEKGRRVAWRLVYNWIDLQLAFVEAGQAAMAELMLGFALSTQRDGEGVPKTFYEVLLGAEGPRLLAEHL